MISLWFFFSVTVSIFLLSMFRALQFVFTFLFLARRKNRKKNGRSQSNHHHQWEEILIDCLIVSNQPNKKKERNQIIIIIWWIEKIWKENLLFFYWIPSWKHRKSFTWKKSRIIGHLQISLMMIIIMVIVVESHGNRSINRWRHAKKKMKMWRKILLFFSFKILWNLIQIKKQRFFNEIFFMTWFTILMNFLFFFVLNDFPWIWT